MSLFRAAMRHVTLSLATLATFGVTAFPAMAGSAQEQAEDLYQQTLQAIEANPFPEGSTMDITKTTPGPQTTLFDVVLHPAGSPGASVPMQVACGLYREATGKLAADPWLDYVMEESAASPDTSLFMNPMGIPTMILSSKDSHIAGVFVVKDGDFISNRCRTSAENGFEVCAHATDENAINTKKMLLSEAKLLARLCTACTKQVANQGQAPGFEVITGYGDPTREAMKNNTQKMLQLLKKQF